MVAVNNVREAREVISVSHEALQIEGTVVNGYSESTVVSKLPAARISLSVSSLLYLRDMIDTYVAEVQKAVGRTRKSRESRYD